MNRFRAWLSCQIRQLIFHTPLLYLVAAVIILGLAAALFGPAIRQFGGSLILPLAIIVIIAYLLSLIGRVNRNEHNRGLAGRIQHFFRRRR